MYRGHGDFPLPAIVRFDHLSFYGWIEQGARCLPASRVSPWTPLDQAFVVGADPEGIKLWEEVNSKRSDQIPGPTRHRIKL